MFGQQLKITFRKPLGPPLKKPTPLFLLTPTPLPPPVQKGGKNTMPSHVS